MGKNNSSFMLWNAIYYEKNEVAVDPQRCFTWKNAPIFLSEN